MSGFFEASYKKLNVNDFNKYTFPKVDGINWQLQGGIFFQ